MIYREQRRKDSQPTSLGYETTTRRNIEELFSLLYLRNDILHVDHRLKGIVRAMRRTKHEYPLLEGCKNHDPTTYDALLKTMRREIINDEWIDHKNSIIRGLLP